MPEEIEKGKRKKKVKLLLLIVAAFVLFLVYWLWPRPLTATYYNVEADVTENIRIVQLTDLHGRELGNENDELLSLVSEQKPDLIFITGDMINADDTEISSLCKLVSSLSEMAPVYYSYGNHEVTWMSNSDVDLEKALTNAGANVLELEYEDITVKGQELRIGGYYGYYRTPQMETDDEKIKSEKLAFADDFENTGRQKLLLAHIATSWLDWKRINKHEVGVVFCGHYHGGQIRLPIIDKGLYAPYVGWFPEYTKGIFEGEHATCILSAGLGSNPGIPRIYNPPEIVVADLRPGN